MNVLDIQQRLTALGYNPGPLDGVWGPTTRKAVIAFQTAKKLSPDGVVGPKTLAALNAAATGGGVQATPLKVGEPVWVQEGRRRLGLHESNPALKAFLKSDGKTLGDPERLPWCGDFVETCIRLALPDEILPANPYFARNWLAVGVTCPEPVVGCIAVFERGPNAGHVGFVVGQDKTYLSILGGNQSNSVSVSRIAKSRSLGYRWPKTAGPITVTPMAAATGDITTNEA